MTEGGMFHILFYVSAMDLAALHRMLRANG
jgi:hypothetical protein